jgi:hypothetical protein
VIRRLTALLLAGLIFSACGTESTVTAMRTWVTQSSFRSSLAVLSSDAHNSAKALEIPSMSSANLHTVCGVLLVDTESANASLPTPDSQSTTLLSSAYTNLGAAANECYNAAGSPAKRARALLSTSKGLAALSEAAARIDVATASK